MVIIQNLINILEGYLPKYLMDKLGSGGVSKCFTSSPTSKYSQKGVHIKFHNFAASFYVIFLSIRKKRLQKFQAVLYMINC